MKTITVILLIVALFTFRTGAQNYVSPEVVTTLSGDIAETSGLLNLNGELWTHNDSGDNSEIYQIDPSDGEVIRTVEVVNAANVDWEDITRDNAHIYIGDIGNNDGSRTDLTIYRILTSDIDDNDEVEAEEISFYYEDQTSFEPNYHNTNFDCEALIHYQGNLYLFTKNWLDYKTNCYVLPDSPGNYEAMKLDNFDAGCLISGATILPTSGMVVLIGYTTSGGSYNWLFSGFEGDDFFGGVTTKLIWTVLSQIEGVCDAGGSDIYISSEEFAGFMDPTLYYLDLSDFTTGTYEMEQKQLVIHSSMNGIHISAPDSGALSGTLKVFNMAGALMGSRKVGNESSVIFPMTGIKGAFIVVLENKDRVYSKKIMIP